VDKSAFRFPLSAWVEYRIPIVPTFKRLKSPMGRSRMRDVAVEEVFAVSKCEESGEEACRGACVADEEFGFALREFFRPGR
jgi:hypothetical protein